MTSNANNFNGIASGTTVTTANSGGVSGTAFAAAIVPTGGTLTAQSAAAYEGATGLQIVYPAATSTAGYVYWAVSAAVGVRVSTSYYFRYLTVPTATEQVSMINPGAGVKLTTGGNLQAWDAGSAPKASVAVPTNTWVYVEHAVTAGTTTSNGRIEFNVFLAATGATLVSYDSGTTASTGTTAVGQTMFGRNGNATSVGTSQYDLLAASNVLTSGFPGTRPVITNTGGLKVWTGSAWAVKPVKVWTGTAWVVKPVKRWTGTAWVTTP